MPPPVDKMKFEVRVERAVEEQEDVGQDGLEGKERDIVNTSRVFWMYVWECCLLLFVFFFLMFFMFFFFRGFSLFN